MILAGFEPVAIIQLSNVYIVVPVVSSTEIEFADKNFAVPVALETPRALAIWAIPLFNWDITDSFHVLILLISSVGA